jgi:signal transduction histidine kinase
LAAVSVVGDPEALGRAVRNVCDNAVRHASSVIELSVAVVDGFAVVRVGDDGPGIAVQDRVRVFDRFVRLDADRSRRGGGTGLGLAIVAEIVAGHHGTVGITDRDHGGTTVTMRLPLR